MTVSAPHIVITGGGTGGHVIPAIAIAEEITRRGGRARFIGTRNRLEAKLVPQAGFDIDYIDVAPLVAGGIARTLRGLASIPPAVAKSCFVIRRHRPDVVVGVGGYVAGPVVLGARLLGLPTALVEQNATVGMTNRILAKLVKRAFVAYEETVDAFPKGIGETSGNPVKQAILAAARKKWTPASAKTSGKRIRILVMGGSQGASAIDDRVPAAMDQAALRDDVTVTHQCSAGSETVVRDAYAAAGITAEVTTFIENTAAAYAACDMVVARAGATTVSELTVMGLPAILIPYPHHKDRQQEKNAAPMKQAGAAVVLDEWNTGVDEMADAMATLVRDSTRRRQAAEASYRLGRRDAAERIVDGLFSLAGRY